MQQGVNVDEKWIQYQRKHHKTTTCLACQWCKERPVFRGDDEYWRHVVQKHPDKLPAGEEEREKLKPKLLAEALVQRQQKDDLRDSSGAAVAFNERPAGLNTASTPNSPLKPELTLREGPPLVATETDMLNLGGTPGNLAIKDLQIQSRKRNADSISNEEPNSPSTKARESPTPSPPRRSKGRPQPGLVHLESERPPATGKLWNPERDSPAAAKAPIDPSNIATLQRSRMKAGQSNPRISLHSQSPLSPRRVSAASTHFVPTAAPPQVSTLSNAQYDMIPQPETRPISQDQLVAEVKGIYAGLVMVEAKCIEVDTKQAALSRSDPRTQPKLNNEQWQALIALHRTLLHEHHDFFLASQHPSASQALRGLASKYAMPARMWRHGIHSFLELLRHRLPGSLDHMLFFIYLAYSMMALLYETVPAFEDTWIECLGDLGRYRMAIEDDDVRDREVWTGVARHWYSKASNRAPTTGRLYHHLAILARPNAVQQLFYYSKSLCVKVLFISARESIMTLFDPLLNTESTNNQYKLPPLDAAFVTAHGILFTRTQMDRFDSVAQEFLDLLDSHIGRVTRKFMEQGPQIAISNCVQLLDFASKGNKLMKAMSTTPGEDEDISMSEVTTDSHFDKASTLFIATLSIILLRIGDPNILPFLHTTLAFMLRVTNFPGAMSILAANFPWALLATMLNTLISAYKTPARLESDTFPTPEKETPRPFPDDYALRGLLYVEDYFPPDWFATEAADDDEKTHEPASVNEHRRERILWIAVQIARRGNWLSYDRENMNFTVP
ncbi:hypothetical protein F5884DRAFT_777558 [Xylogone sp. PMI_703]|nr:hypothetical protein F5884DRAFT_777558 [Xylogone sp. PMI_703]